MLRYPTTIDSPNDCSVQDHVHLLTTNRLQVWILTQRRHGYEILSAAVESSLNDDAVTVKREIIKWANLDDILLDGKQFDISWEERLIKGVTTPIFTALAPSPYAQYIEHAFLILLEPPNDSTQFPATHNYTWFSQTRFNLCEQLWKNLHAQRAYLNDRRFLIIDGSYLVNWDSAIPSAPILQSDDSAGHSLRVRDLLLSN